MGAYNPSRAWACIELVVAALLVAAGLQGYTYVSATLWLAAVGLVLVWWRGPGWRAVGLDRPSSIVRVLIVGVTVGVGYQFLSLIAIEPTLRT